MPAGEQLKNQKIIYHKEFPSQNAPHSSLFYDALTFVRFRRFPLQLKRFDVEWIKMDVSTEYRILLFMVWVMTAKGPAKNREDRSQPIARTA